MSRDSANMGHLSLKVRLGGGVVIRTPGGDVVLTLVRVGHRGGGLSAQLGLTADRAIPIRRAELPPGAYQPTTEAQDAPALTGGEDAGGNGPPPPQ